MNGQDANITQPHLGATFYPGGVDDFYIPELVSPAPQRSMPEVPQQIQNNLAHLEQEADMTRHLAELQTNDPMYQDAASNESPYVKHNHSGSNMQSTLNRVEGGEPKGYGTSNSHQRQLSQPPNASDQPSFSPFPQIRNRSPNVPPSDAEKETILENARIPVLNSNDPEMQLTWAQDALSHVEVAMTNEGRLAGLVTTRPRTPRVEHQLRVDAISVVTFLADQQHPKADFLRGMWLEFGKFGFRMDKKEAYRCYYRAAHGGYSRAEYRMGMQFENSNDILKAIKHYSLGVEGHDSASNYRLGMMTLLGQHGQQQDYQKALEMIKRSADTADENAPQGAYVYGMLQARELPKVSIPEKFLPLDIDSALYNIEKAAYLGFGKAQTKMGAAYELCHFGCEFDPTLSLHYNNLAARQGDAEAEMAISKWFLCGYEGVFNKSEELAFTYAQRAAQIGLPTAEFAMGYFYEVGIHTSVSLKEARIWYTKAADHGNKDAAARIEGITRSKTLSRKDHEKIAVAKINSARASRYGRRPERLTRPSMPSMPEVSSAPSIPYGTVNMPEVNIPYQGFASHGPYSPPTTSPTYAGSAYSGPVYPTSPTLPSDSYNRSRLNPGTGIFKDERVDVTVSSLAGPLRPNSITTNQTHGSGRGTGPQRFGPGITLPPHSPDPQGLKRPSTGMGPQQASYDVRQKPLPSIDIGFSAPPDLSSADRKKRTERPENPIANHPPAGRGNEVRLERLSSRPQVIGQNTLQGVDVRTQSPYHVTGSPAMANRPPRQEPIPSRPAASSSAVVAVSKPPSVSTNTIPVPSDSASSGARPGKGPSTFEEMGVPQGKKGDDCILM